MRTPLRSPSRGGGRCRDRAVPASRGYRDVPAATLPQGVRKLLDIAMAVAGRPRLLLLDEPTSGISIEEKFGIMDVVMSALKSRSITVLFVEHDMEIVERLCRPRARLLRRHGDRRRRRRPRRCATRRSSEFDQRAPSTGDRPGTRPMLKVSGLDVSIGPVPIIRDASLAFDEGEMCGLIGRNGAGKTTLLRALMGAIPATGRAELGHVDLLALPAHRRGRPRASATCRRTAAWCRTSRSSRTSCLPTWTTKTDGRRAAAGMDLLHHAGGGAIPRAQRAGAVGRPAEDGGARPRPDGGHPHAAAGRAVRGPGAGPGAPPRRGAWPTSSASASRC